MDVFRDVQPNGSFVALVRYCLGRELVESAKRGYFAGKCIEVTYQRQTKSVNAKR